MKREDIIRAWKDEDFYLGLGEKDKAALPANPAGLVELDDGDLRGVSGGTTSDLSLPPSACKSIWYCTETGIPHPSCP